MGGLRFEFTKRNITALKVFLNLACEVQLKKNFYVIGGSVKHYFKTVQKAYWSPDDKRLAPIDTWNFNT